MTAGNGANRPRRKGRVELTWTNKDWRLLAREDGTWDWVPPADYRVAEVRLLHEVAAVGDAETDNLLIHGDPLYALRSLVELPTYAERYLGHVKLAYLDPPFNTQQAFEHYDDALEHSIWLTMMRDRLEQVHALLADDGTVWVHLDDAEMAYCRVLMDEIFGREQFVGTVIWEKADTLRNDARQFSVSHDYLLVYSRSPGWVANKLPRTDDMNAVYRNPDNDPRGPWLAATLISPSYRASGDFEVVTPSGVTHRAPTGTSWRVPKETFDRLVAENRIWFGKKGDATPQRKLFLSDAGDRVIDTIWRVKEVGGNRQSKAEIKKLFPGEVPFATPKPERLLQRVIHATTEPGDIVLDCFLGSGTTAAVAHKMRRRWVGVEWSKENVETFARPRLTKVVEGDDPNGITEAEEWAGGGGFRVLEVAPSMFEDDEGQIVLAEWATNGALAEATAAQLHFPFELQSPFCGRKGKTRLAVIDGHVSTQVVELLIEQLDDAERVVVCGTSIDPQATGEARELRPGSRVRKIPDSLLADYQDAGRRLRAANPRSDEPSVSASPSENVT